MYNLCIGMIKKVLVITSVVIFALATFGVTFSHVALIPLGLAIYASTKLVD